MHSCIHIALDVQEEAMLVLNHLNDTVYEVFNISYHKVTDYLNTHNEIILNNIKDYMLVRCCYAFVYLVVKFSLQMHAYNKSSAIFKSNYLYLFDEFKAYDFDILK